MTYQELLDVAIAYTDRQDSEVTVNAATFILMTEARINRLLKTRQQSARIQTLIEDCKSFYSLPLDYNGIRHIQLVSYDPTAQTAEELCGCTKYNFGFLNPEQMTDMKLKAVSNCYFSIQDNQITIHPVPEATATRAYAIELLYYQKLPNLNGTDTTNWVSIDHPDMYMSGIAAEIELFTKNYDAADGWADRLTSAIGELANADELERWSGSQLTIKVA